VEFFWGSESRTSFQNFSFQHPEFFLRDPCGAVRDMFSASLRLCESVLIPSRSPQWILCGGYAEWRFFLGDTASTYGSGWEIDIFLLVDKLVLMKVEEAGLFAAKTHLSEMVAKVETQGVVYRITKRGKPVAELRPIEEGRPKIRLPFGYGAGTVPYMAPDFEAPLDDMREYME
jgi:prevent-host-death family protein